MVTKEKVVQRWRPEYCHDVIIQRTLGTKMFFLEIKWARLSG